MNAAGFVVHKHPKMNRQLRNIAITILALAAALWLLQRTHVLPRWKNPFAASAITIDNTPLLVKNIRSIAQLITIEYHDEVVVDSVQNGSRMIPLPPFVFPVRQSLVLVVRGRLIAGVDLSRLDSSHFKGTSDSLHIVLPKAKVLEVIVNPSDVETFAESGTWNQGAVTALKAKAQYRITKNALNQGVLRRSDEKARNLVEQLLMNAGYKKVVVTSR